MLSQEWYTFKIAGIEIQREKVKQEDLNDVKKCDGCLLGLGSYHLLNCHNQWIDCPVHGRELFHLCPLEGYKEESTNDK